MEKYRHLGRKTLWLFIFSKSTTPLVFLLIAVVSLVASGYLNNNALTQVLNYILVGSLFFFIVSFLMAIIISEIEYMNYGYLLSEDAFKVKHGIFNKEETSIPYRQIQSVDLRQDLTGQILGISRLVILTAGHDDNDVKGESEAEFPAIDTTTAKSIQAELIKRSNTEKVIIQK